MFVPSGNICKHTTGVGTDAFRPRVLLGFSESMFFLLPQTEWSDIRADIREDWRRQKPVEWEEAARNVYEALKKQTHMRSLNLSQDEERKNGKRKVLCTSRRMMKDMWKFCEKEGLGLICSADYLGDGVRVIERTPGGKWEGQENRCSREWQQ